MARVTGRSGTEGIRPGDLVVCKKQMMPWYVREFSEASRAYAHTLGLRDNDPMRGIHAGEIMFVVDVHEEKGHLWHTLISTEDPSASLNIISGGSVLFQRLQQTPARDTQR